MVRKSDLPHRTGQLWDALAQGSPEMVDDALANKPRAPRAAPRQAERLDVQRPLIVFLRKHLQRGAVVFSVPNMARSREQTWALMRDGMLPGVPDICIVISRMSLPWVGFIECKHPTAGQLSDAQIEVQTQLRALGIPVMAECRSIPEAVQWLNEQGVKLT